MILLDIERNEPTVCLLIFTLNSEKDAIEIFNQTHRFIGEAVIIDSSDSEKFIKLQKSFEGTNAKLFHTIPLGYPDPLRSYALSKIQSEWVLYIDSDERPSNALLEKTLHLGEEDAYYVPRKEIRGYYTEHIRLFRKNNVYYSGIIHETASVKGKLSYLDLSQCLFHLSGENVPKDRKYATIEVYTGMLSEIRPSFILVSLRKLIEGSWRKKRALFLMNLFACTYLLLKKAILTIRAINEEKKDMRDYLNLMIEEFSRMDVKAKYVALSSSIDIARQGSLTDYLNLHDEIYIQSLEGHPNVTQNGLDNLINLLNWRVDGVNLLDIEENVGSIAAINLR